MIARIALATLIAAATAGSAFALIPAEQIKATVNETVIAKNDPNPVFDMNSFEECIDDACTETVSN